MNAKDYAKFANEVAKRSKNIAMDLVSEKGLRGNVTLRDVIRIINEDFSGMYDKQGNLTEKGVKEMTNTIRSMFKLPSDEATQKITVDQFIKKSVNDAENGFDFVV